MPCGWLPTSHDIDWPAGLLVLLIVAAVLKIVHFVLDFILSIV